jgi:hypothetical protein
MEKTHRTHVVLPRTLIDAVDRLFGPPPGGRFVAEAIVEKLRHEQQGRALREATGKLALADHPEWVTPEQVSAWVREVRAESDASAGRKLRHYPQQ